MLNSGLRPRVSFILTIFTAAVLAKGDAEGLECECQAGLFGYPVTELAIIVPFTVEKTE